MRQGSVHIFAPRTHPTSRPTDATCTAFCVGLRRKICTLPASQSESFGTISKDESIQGRFCRRGSVEVYSFKAHFMGPKAQHKLHV